MRPRVLRWEPLTHSQLDAIYEQDILPDVLDQYRDPPSNELVMIVGQPAAGQPGIKRALQRDAAGPQGLCDLTTEVLRPYDPALDAAALDPAAAEAVRHSARHWQLRTTSEGLAGPLLLDVDDVDQALYHAEAAQRSGAQVRLVAIACPPAFSRLGILERHATLLAEGIPSAWITLEQHDAGVAATSALVAAAETSPSIDRLTLVGREGIYHDTHDKHGERADNAVALLDEGRLQPISRSDSRALATRLSSTLESLDRLEAPGLTTDRNPEVGLMAAAMLHDLGEIDPENTGAGLLGEAITRLDATLRVIEEVGRGPIADLAYEQTQPHAAIGPDVS